MTAVVGEHYTRGLYGGGHGQQQQSLAAALAAGTAALSMLLLSGLALIVATPLLVIFSPVLAPAAITVALLTAGLVSSGGFGAAAVGVLAWMYRHLQTPDQQLHDDAKDWAHHHIEHQ